MHDYFRYHKKIKEKEIKISHSKWPLLNLTINQLGNHYLTKPQNGISVCKQKTGKYDIPSFSSYCSLGVERQNPTDNI